jgi:flavin reductase (DIM6/NTAB) family NADH-FMN oxidoreductase RutF
MKEIPLMMRAEEAINAIAKGAFLTVRSEGVQNTMTIGWALLGVIWKKSTLMVAVRNSRYTFGLIEKAPDFAVSIPATDMSRELAFCGTKSGRDLDKLKMCNLETASARQVVSPIINVPGMHFECKIVYKSAMNPDFLDKNTDQSLYPQKDYHTLYFGEILACYEL